MMTLKGGEGGDLVTFEINNQGIEWANEQNNH